MKNIKLKSKRKSWIDTGKVLRSDFYVYYLIDPRNNLPFYVGKGYDYRMYEHEWCTKRGKVPNNNKHLYYKIKQILKESVGIIYKKVLENVVEKMAFDRETNDIKKYGRRDNGTGILCNLTDGGEGTSGYITSEKSKRKRRRNMPDQSGKNNPMFGKYHSELTKRKMREKKIDVFDGKKNPNYGNRWSKKLRSKASKSIKNRNFIVATSFIFENTDIRQKIKIDNLRQWCLDNGYSHMSMKHICTTNGMNEEKRRGWKCIDKSIRNKISKKDYFNNPYKSLTF